MKRGKEMKKAAILIIIMLILSTIAGCLYDGEHWDLYQMTRCNVIGTNGAGESESVEIKVIEEDTFGRTLYSYTVYAEGSEYYGYELIWVVAICQKSDRKSTYYYEDECFIISDTIESISDEDINDLKLSNDWNKPLNEDKLSSRPIHRNYNGYSGIIAYDSFSHGIGMEAGAEAGVRFVDYDGKDKILYFVAKYDADYYDGIDVKSRYYLMIINEDGSYDKDTFVIEIEDLYNYQKQLHEFKINNGWSFS